MVIDIHNGIRALHAKSCGHHQLTSTQS